MRERSDLRNLVAVAAQALLLDVREEVSLLQVLIVQLVVHHLARSRDDLLRVGRQEASTTAGTLVHDRQRHAAAVAPPGVEASTHRS